MQVDKLPARTLLGPNGRPISSATFQNKKADPPKLGPSFGDWAGRDMSFMSLPGGGVIQFDLNKLTLEDFRAMRDHYQVNASLSVLSFMQHQSEFTVECENTKIAKFCNDQLHENWTMLNRAMSTANWAGFSPNALEWDNNYDARSIGLDKIKDLVPEECVVNWKEVEGWAPPHSVKPKFKVYNGIKQLGGTSWPIPVENSYWYPLLMENGNYYGRKLLRPAFQSWFFSILIHLFANRYYERFGEPIPVGRAPFDEPVEGIKDSGGNEIMGNQYMLSIIQQLRNRSAIVMPNSKTEDRNGRPMWDYDLEYLESQMRGADFERYMTRLDEEISIGMFTPILLLRTADVGSYNLGVGHMQVYLWMLNAMNDDRAYYLDRYILSKMTDYNFGVNAPRPHVKFRKLGNSNATMIQAILVQLIKNGGTGVDLQELGSLAGLTLKEIEQTVAPTPAPGQTADGTDPATSSTATPAQQTKNTANEISERVRAQVLAAFNKHRFGADTKISMGYKHRFERSLQADGVPNPLEATDRVYRRMDNWLADVLPLGENEFSGADSFMGLFNKVLGNEIESIASAA